MLIIVVVDEDLLGNLEFIVCYEVMVIDIEDGRIFEILKVDD